MRCVLVFRTGTIRPANLDQVPDGQPAPKEVVILDRKRGPVRLRYWRRTPDTNVPIYEEVEGATESE